LCVVAPVPASAGPSSAIAQSFAWLEENLRTHGGLRMEYGDVKTMSAFTAAAEGCDLIVTQKNTSFIPGKGLTHSDNVATIPLGKLDLGKLGWMKEGVDDAFGCTNLQTAEKVIRVHRTDGGAQGDRNENIFSFCFSQHDLAEQSVKVVGDMARACGAK
jgi:hypothetical protein